MAEHTGEKVVLVVGALGLDRLLTVPNYPEADAKIRTTSYCEQGGGNAANTASAMGLLQDAEFLRDKNFKVKLLTVVGDDSVGQQLISELQAANVDTSSPLFQKGPPGSTTSFTTIIVSEQEHTRTCFHTPGSCGMLTVEDVKAVDLDVVFENVMHLHSDSRFTECSLFLMKEAKKRGISVSCDTEKDRKTKALDELIQLTDVLFTNSSCLRDYLTRLDSEFEKERGREALPKPVITSDDATDDPELLKFYARCFTPSAFFARWCSQTGKQVVVTQGEMGALHFETERSSHDSLEKKHGGKVNEIVLSRSVGALHIRQSSNDGVQHNSKHRIRHVGVLEGVQITDTTGAGDAFIGGYLLGKLAGPAGNPTDFAMSLGSWVAGCKVEGPGARSALPAGARVDEVLGKTVESVKISVASKLLPFQCKT